MQKTKFEETDQTSEPDMAGLLELLDQEFKTAMINMLKSLMDKVEHIQEWMGGNSLVVQWLRLCASTAGGMGLISGWGNKILHVAWPSPAPKKKEKEKNG